jgi:diguanylate cyclase (GGDEF)-like protein/PAS domain S-box-containing protein
MQTPRADLARALGRFSDVDTSVYAQQLQNLALRRSDILAHLIVAGAAVASLWRLYPVWVCPLWLGALLVILLVRDRIQRRFQRASINSASSRVWGHRFTWGALATGCVWGLVASVFVVTDDLISQVLALTLIGGMTIAGIARNAASTPMMTAFVSPIMTLTAAALLVHPNSFHLSMVFMLGAFGIVLATTGRTLHQSVNADLRVTLEMVKTGTTLASAQGVARIGSWEIERVARTVVWSEEMFRIFGDEPPSGEPSMALMLERVHPEDRQRVQAALDAWLAGEAEFAVDHRVRTAGGATRWIHQLGLTQPDFDGRPARHTAIVQDITERKLAEEKLQFANVVMRTQLEASEDGILVVNRERRVISFNERFALMFACPTDLLDGGDYDAVLARVVALTKDSDPYQQRVQFSYEHPGQDSHDEIETVDGRHIQSHAVTLTGPEGEYLGRAWFFRDVTKQKEALDQAVRTSRLDQLTGLVNRGAFVEDLRASLARVARGERGFAVLYIDLDHFKDVNDALGHPAGDKLLRTVAERLLASTRPSDTVARFGGDEFAVIATDVDDLSVASRLADKLIKVISEPYNVNGVPVRTSASIGIALHAAGSTDAETMLSHADLALYSAKAEGRSEHRSFTVAMDTEVRTRVALGAELHDAIANGQLFLLYQPQVHLGSGRVVGVEALVRWRHPVRGVLGPGLFIPVAEQTGVIGKLGQWVLATACRQAKAWLDAGAPSPRVAINVSSLQFKTALAFETDIHAALAENALSPEHLELELTETVLMDAYREHANLLLRLRRSGLTIAIDDFGTGYSSLDYLRRFPVNRIKIAQEFVRDLEMGTGDAAIVKATIGLARELGIEVIAEGVERLRQLELLQAWGCGEAQGYYFAKPLPPDRVTALLCSAAPLRAGSVSAMA